MEETRELTTPGAPASVPLTRGDPELQARAAALCQRGGVDLEALSGEILETAAAALGFERGFLVLVAGGTSGPAGGEPPVRLVGSRAALAGAPGRCEVTWRRVENAEYAVSARVVRRALECREPVTEDGGLAGGGAGPPRAVLCHAVEICPGVRAAVYLDRPPGGRGISRRDPPRLEAFLEHCAPLLGRAYLHGEARGGREAAVAGPAAEDAEDAEGARDAAEAEEVGEVQGWEEPAPAAEVPPSYYGLVGADPSLRKTIDVMEKVKNSNLNVCVFGESGTGKELVARAIHEAGNRREHPFVSENCGAISENLLESELFGHVKGAFTGADEDHMGLFELAHRGTLFLDEIGDMSEGMQRKLLRALQEGTIRPIGARDKIHVDVRVICASNRDLNLLVSEGRFRADLYYRLNVIQIHVPPLRERKGDIPLLVEHFARRLGEEEGIRRRFSSSALEALVQYSWPGNVRELRNVVRRALLAGSRRVIARKDVLPLLATTRAAPCLGKDVERDGDHLLLRIPSRQRFGELIAECERLILLNALEEHGWNKSRVTRLLKIPRQSLYNKIARHRLEPRSE